MLKGLYTAYTGMLNEQHRMDVLTNNLANAATIGYKKEGATSQSFTEVFAYKIKDASENPNIARRVGVHAPGVKIGENYTDYSQGAFQNTDNEMDLALSGPGFFNIEFTNKQGETSTKYTREGAFIMDNQGFLLTKDGDFVLGTNGQIKLNPLEKVVFGENGSVFQNDRQVATLQLTDFEDYNYLEHYGENMYQTVEGAQTIQAGANTKVFSGFLEASNVQTVQEMIEMINVTRAYETNQKAVQAHDTTLEIAVNQLGKL